MNCPNCGAALQVVPNRTHLSCQYCQSLHFPEPIAEGVVPLDQDHPFVCPCCERPLAAAALDGDTVGYCTACRGILLSSDHFAQSDLQPARGESDVDIAGSSRSTRPSSGASRRCPRCGRRTDTHTYGGGGNAVIDSCHRCHLVWLDAGELTVLEQFPAEACPSYPILANGPILRWTKRERVTSHTVKQTRSTSAPSLLQRQALLRRQDFLDLGGDLVGFLFRELALLEHVVRLDLLLTYRMTVTSASLAIL